MGIDHVENSTKEPILTRCLQKIRAWFKGQVGYAPDSSAACEFDCRKTDCTHERWEHCENRRQKTSPTQRRRGKPRPRNRTRSK